MFADGQIHAETGLFTELGTAGIGEPKVPVLLLHIGTCRDRQIGPHLDGLSSTERWDNDVGTVVAAAFNVHANDGEGRHPGLVGNVGL